MGKKDRNYKRGGEGSSTVDQEAIQQQIRQLAYELFCKCGCARGHDVEHWLEAERRVLGLVGNG